MTTPARIDAADLSNNNEGPFDFVAARLHGVKLLTHKATEGGTFVDPDYAPRRRAVSRVSGMKWSAYHFARPSSSGAHQAEFFLQHATPRKGDVRPALDLEDAVFGSWSIRKRTAWVKDWVETVVAEIKAPPFIYTHFDLLDNFGCPLWASRYSNPMWAPPVPSPWSRWTMWQFTNGIFGEPRSVPGLGHVDLSELNGLHPIRLLDTLTIGYKKPAPEPVPHPAPEPPLSTKRMDPRSYFLGARGPAIHWLGSRLIHHGYERFYPHGPGEVFTKHRDMRAVRAFQRAQGWRGADADGLPGRVTLRRLERK